jgi:NTP pyrophosphatase (non-canonical NTP hydrolase)
MMSGMADRFKELYDWALAPKIKEIGEMEARYYNGQDRTLELIAKHVNASVGLTLALMDVVEQLAKEKPSSDEAVDSRSTQPTVHELQRVIGEWSRRTFPQSTIDSTIRHLWTEMVELDRAFTSGKDENCREEVADLFILLVQLCNRAGIDLQQAVRQKHEENLNRQWDAPDEYGVVYHTKGK